MARAGLNAILRSKLARHPCVSSSLACAINRVSLVSDGPRISWSWVRCHAGVAEVKVSMSTEEKTTENTASKEVSSSEVTETREEYIRRVRTDTRAKIDYEELYKRLHKFLSYHKPVKATEVNMICYNTTNLQDLQRVKELLHLFRCSPSVQRLSVANVAVAMCLRLGVPEEALELICDPVQYGVFPSPFTMNKLMLVFANRGDVKSVNKLCEAKRAVDMESGFYQLQYIIRARIVALLDKYDKNSEKLEEVACDDGATDGETTPTNSEASPNDIETTPTQSLTDEDSTLSSQDNTQQHQDEAELSDESGNTTEPVDDTSEPSDAGGCGMSHDAMKEELDSILQLCDDNLKQELGPAGYYCVHEKLMEKELDSLAEYVLHKVEEEKIPEKVVLHLRLDHHRMRSRYSDVVEILKQLKASNKTLEWDRLQILQNFFKNGPTSELREIVQDLKLEEMTDPAPPKWPEVPTYQY